jgi:hypothetical protein
MKTLTILSFSLAAYGTACASPIPKFDMNPSFKPVAREGYTPPSIGGYTPAALSYLDPDKNEDSPARLAKALQNPSQAYSD